MVWTLEETIALNRTPLLHMQHQVFAPKASHEDKKKKKVLGSSLKILPNIIISFFFFSSLPLLVFMKDTRGDELFARTVFFLIPVTVGRFSLSHPH